MNKFTFPVLVGMGLSLVWGCEGSGNDADDATGGAGAASAAIGGLPIADCSSRCGQKASACGATSSQQATICGDYCSRGLTEAQMSCLEADDCNTLATMNSACLDTGSGTPTSSSSSSSSGGLACKEPGESCSDALECLAYDCSCNIDGELVTYDNLSVCQGICKDCSDACIGSDNVIIELAVGCP
jgi:hypothetical protein